MESLKKNLQDAMNANPFLSVSDALYKCLKEEIISLHLKPGENINESQLASNLNISRSPVKSAIDALIEEGYIIRNKGKGACVTLLNTKEHSQIMEARIAIESQAAYIAAKTISTEELSRLKLLLKKFQTAKETVDYSLWSECDDEFHRIIIYATRNHYLIEMYKLIHPKMERYRRYLSNIYAGQQQSIYCEFPLHHHIAIYNALASHYSSIAEEEMTKDILRMTKGIGYILPTSHTSI